MSGPAVLGKKRDLSGRAGRAVSGAAAWLAAILLANASPALAGSGLPELKDILKAESPSGRGEVSWFWMTAYEAELWTDAPEWSMEQPFALSLTYRMSYSSLELVDRFQKELTAVSGLPAATIEDFAIRLSRVVPNVEKGDRLTFVHEPGEPVRFFHNGQSTGRIAEPGFADAFFGLWLSEKAMEPSLRTSLLARE